MSELPMAESSVVFSGVERDNETGGLMDKRDEGVFVDPPLVFKRVFQETRGARPGWRKGKSPALDRESMRRRALVGTDLKNAKKTVQGLRVKKGGLSPRLEWKEGKTMNAGGVENRI
ncbi:hypothetical protein TNCV_3380131 [Trichonephila clavipes]|nr:hypothetical protein TNCV_3380131 [Trichonephila clavipes]